MPEGQSESTESLIKAACDREDALSRKPYYVNLSIGRYEFTADADADLGAMIQQADTYLYEAKKLRRASVCRVQSEQTRRAE
jgi:PleD family two-component response regulator